MLINHDFDWEADLEESPRPGVDAPSGKGPRPEFGFVSALGHPQPGHQLVIIERTRGFSRSTLILAIIALALSAASLFPKTTHLHASSLIDQPQPSR
jgi:hypothetical protein